MCRAYHSTLIGTRGVIGRYVIGLALSELDVDIHVGMRIKALPLSEFSKLNPLARRCPSVYGTQPYRSLQGRQSVPPTFGPPRLRSFDGHDCITAHIASTSTRCSSGPSQHLPKGNPTTPTCVLRSLWMKSTDRRGLT